MTTQGAGQVLYKQCCYRDASPMNQCRKKTEKEQLDIEEDQESQSHDEWEERGAVKKGANHQSRNF